MYNMVLTDNLPGSSFGNASQFYFNVRWGGREIWKKNLPFGRDDSYQKEKDLLSYKVHCQTGLFTLCPYSIFLKESSLD